MRQILKRLDQLEAGRLGKGGLPENQLSVLMVRPANQTEEERAEFDAAVRRAHNEGQAVSVYDGDDDPAYIKDLERFLG